MIWLTKKLKAYLKTIVPQKNKSEKIKRHGSEFDEDIKFVYTHENFVMPVIMGCRSPKAIGFRSGLGFNQYDITLRKESSVLKPIMDTFEGENMETQFYVLGYGIILYFNDYKLTVEVD